MCKKESRNNFQIPFDFILLFMIEVLLEELKFIFWLKTNGLLVFIDLFKDYFLIHKTRSLEQQLRAFSSLFLRTDNQIGHSMIKQACHGIIS